MQWLMWQMGGIGPMLGQVHHFLQQCQGQGALRRGALLKEGIASTACSTAAGRGVHGRRLFYRRHRHLALDLTLRVAPIDMTKFPNVLRWYKAIAARPAVVKGYHVPVKQPGIPMPA